MDKINLGGSIKRKIVNPDLQEERDKRVFDHKELEKFLSGNDIVSLDDYYADL